MLHYQPFQCSSLPHPATEGGEKGEVKKTEDGAWGWWKNGELCTKMAKPGRNHT